MSRKREKSMKTKNKTTIEAIVFDAYGTLFDLKTFAREASKTHAGKGENLLEIVRRKQLEYIWTRSLFGKYVDFATITKDAIRFGLESLNIPQSPDEMEKLYLVFLHLDPFDDVEAALADLDEANARVAILSNGTQEMLDAVIQNADLDLLSEEVISVEGAKTYKPDPKAYQHALTHLEIFEKSRILYVSGNTWDVAGAKAFGFKVAWVNRTGQPSFDANLQQWRPDYELSSLRELVNLFEERDTGNLTAP